MTMWVASLPSPTVKVRLGVSHEPTAESAANAAVASRKEGEEAVAKL
uniref:Uncharacterized protein n=1 Tax=Setaria italica TaxID=4555 RepID=K4A3N0_SETIT